MRKLLLSLAVLTMACGTKAPPPEAAPKIPEGAKPCVECHVKKNVSGSALRDWRLSKHGQLGAGCQDCHLPPDDAAQAIKDATTTCEDKRVRRQVSSKACAACHIDQVAQFGKGKHAAAWVAMNAMPGTKDMPPAVLEKGCASCHRIGKADGKCDSCHTRHLFSAAEARRPEACQQCHTGFDHAQSEMYATSKHGAIYATGKDGWNFDRKLSLWATGDPLKPAPTVPRAPTCALCHMSDGDHGVKTSWGFLALRLPEPDEAWLKDRTRILQALGVLDDKGNPTARLAIVEAGKVARLKPGEWQAERDKMIAVCNRCHSKDYATKQLELGDKVVREADKLMAEALDVVESLYKDGILRRKEPPIAWHIDLLRFYDVEHPLEQKLWVMFLEHRQRAFQGAFHQSPDYLHWYGWAEMKRDVAEIKHEAAELRKAKAKAEEKPVEKVEDKAAPTKPVPAKPAPAKPAPAKPAPPAKPK